MKRLKPHFKHMKFLGKLIQSEVTGSDCRDPNPNECAYLLDQGFIAEVRWGEQSAFGHIDFSEYKVTDLGREAYFSTLED